MSLVWSESVGRSMGTLDRGGGAPMRFSHEPDASISRTKWSLCALMFLQYGVWGAWWVPLGSYLATIDLSDSIGQFYATQGIAAIVAPLVFGVLADRFLSPRILLGLLHLAGAALLLWASSVECDGTLLFAIVLTYMIAFMPTLPLSNAVALHLLKEPERQFPAIRIFGTLGWIAAGLLVGALAAETSALPLRIAALASLPLAGVAFLLPRVEAPAQALGIEGSTSTLADRFGFALIAKLADRHFVVFILASLAICAPLSFYYAYTNLYLVQSDIPRPAAFQTLGQVSEIAFLLALPFFLGRLGIKWVLFVGMGAWALRYLLFSLGWTMDPTIAFIAAGIVLHGICYDFFFVAGQLYIDRALPLAERATGQAFLAFVTLGVGTLLGNLAANAVFVANSPGGDSAWDVIWLIPAAFSATTAIAFLLLFRSSDEKAARP